MEKYAFIPAVHNPTKIGFRMKTPVRKINWNATPPVMIWLTRYCFPFFWGVSVEWKNNIYHILFVGRNLPCPRSLSSQHATPNGIKKNVFFPKKKNNLAKSFLDNDVPVLTMTAANNDSTNDG